MRLVAALAFVSALVVLPAAAGAGSGAPSAVSAAQLQARFRAATGSKLEIDTRASFAGHFVALTLPNSISNQGRYGRFTLYVVGPAHRADDVDQLLRDLHTGEIGASGPSRIFWENGRYLSGERYWLAKKRYGVNVVLWWYGAQRKVDRSFARLHVPLRRAAGASS